MELIKEKLQVKACEMECVILAQHKVNCTNDRLIVVSVWFSIVLVECSLDSVKLWILALFSSSHNRNGGACSAVGSIRQSYSLSEAV
jgi:hypothetical protein